MNPRDLALFLLVAVVLAAGPAEARTWRVEQDGSGDFTVIQDAVDAAGPGDTILIGPGWYQEYWQMPNWPFQRRFVDINYKSELTFIGAGGSQTLIGPTELDDINRQNIGIYGAYGMDALTVENLQLVNLNWAGIACSDTWISIRNCEFVNCRFGIQNECLNGSLIEGCRFDGCYGIGLLIQSPTTGLVVRNCEFVDCQQGFAFSYSGFQDGLVEECTITGGYIGGQFDGGATGTVRDCYFHGQQLTCLVFLESGTVEIQDNWFEQGASDVTYAGALRFVGAYYLVSGQGNTVISQESCLFFNGWPWLDLRNNHFLRGDDDAWYVRIYDPIPPPEEHVDLRENYWGTADQGFIEEWIWDGNDSPTINVFVDFVPFADQPIQTESASWGQVKALFR